MPAPGPREIEFNLREFDMSQIGDNKIIIFIGKRGVGKSTLVLDYLYHNQDLPIGTCISPTDEFNLTYKPHIPDMFIFDEYSPDLVEKFLKRQMNITKKFKQDPSYSQADPRGFLILDDCLYDASSWTKDKCIRWIFMNGRHANVTMLITMQYCMGIPPDLRTNVDYIFICKEPKVSNRRRLFEHYCGMFPTFEMFDQVIKVCTSNYGCLVIDNSSISDKLEDQVFWYRAPMHGEYRMCYDVFWQNQEQRVAQSAGGRRSLMRGGDDSSSSDDDQKRQDQQSDFQKYTNNRSRINFTVNKLNHGDF